MSHDMYAAWATTEIAAQLRKDPSYCFISENEELKNSSTYATREGNRIWPLSDGVIQLNTRNDDTIEMALEFKRLNEGLHGTLTALGQAPAYIDKGYSAIFNCNSGKISRA